MKRLFVLALMLSSFGLYAQAGVGGRMGKETHPKQEMLKNLTPEEAANLKTKKLTLDLNLTESQQNDIYDLELGLAKERKSKMEDLQEKKEKGELEKPTADELYRRMDERLDRQIAHKREMRQILDDEQFDKWEKMGRRHHYEREKIKRRRMGRSR